MPTYKLFKGVILIKTIEKISDIDNFDGAFLRIIREGSFSRAAYSLGIGQPAISSRIKTLEHSVGGRLFTRGRQVTLTPLGQRFLPYAKRTLDILSEGVDAARFTDNKKKGRVTLGALGSLCEGLVGPALKQFIKENPETECIAKSGNHESIMDFLWDGVVELGLVVWPCNHILSTNLSPLILLNESVALAVHPKHPLASQKKVTEDHLTKLAEPLFLLRWWQTHDKQMVRLAQMTGTHMEIPKEVARHLVLSGVGAGFFPRTFIANDLARKHLIEIDVHGLAPFTRTTALVSHKKLAELSSASQRLVKAIKKQAETLELCPL